MDLHLSLSGTADLVGQIHRQLRLAILEGRLQGGEKLPPTRYLAEELGVSRSTVTEAYDRLMSQGLLVARVGAGTYVAPGMTEEPSGSRSRHLVTPLEPLQPWREFRIPPSWLAPSGLECDFRIGMPDLSCFPFAAWRRLLVQESRAFDKQPVVRLQPQGDSQLRTAIAQHIAFARAVSCDADSVIVTNGAQHAFELLSRVLIAPDTVVAVEEPGYPLARACFASFGARLVGVRVDAHGLVVKDLPAAARIVYVTPSHQFPLGMPMTLARRQELLAWAAAHRALIIEDDYDSEFRFEDRPLDSLQNLDRDGLVAYVGTFSKTLFMPLRRGFVVAPRGLREALVAAHWVGALQTPVQGQVALALFIQQGHLAKHIRKMRRLYDRRRRLLLEILRRDFGDWLAPIHSAVGIHLAVRLKRALDLEAVLAAAREQGVVVYPLSRFSSTAPVQQGLVFGFGAIDEAAIALGLSRLRQVIAGARPNDLEAPV